MWQASSYLMCPLPSRLLFFPVNDNKTYKIFRLLLFFFLLLPFLIWNPGHSWLRVSKLFFLNVSSLLLTGFEVPGRTRGSDILKNKKSAPHFDVQSMVKIIFNDFFKRKFALKGSFCSYFLLYFHINLIYVTLVPIAKIFFCSLSHIFSSAPKLLSIVHN